jgi:hypothetical protein
MEGLYFEASATTPYHFLMQSELSTAPSRAQRDLQYRSLDLTLGVQHLQLVGVRYYMALSPTAVASAETNPDLTLLTTVPGQTGTWHIYEVDDAPTVESVEALPAVVTDVQKGGRDWQNMAEAWFNDPSQWSVLRAVSGPDEWPRMERGDVARVRPVDPVDVSNVVQGNSTISFDVSDTGTPVLVKTSYFPNWQVSGADGPYRVSPNFMVVVPTDEHVELRFGRTPVEHLSWLVTLGGIALAVLLWRRRPLDLDRLPEAPVTELQHWTRFVPFVAMLAGAAFLPLGLLYAVLWRVDATAGEVLLAGTELIVLLVLGLGWVGSILRRTGYRDRDLLFLGVPVWNAVVVARAAWRYTSATVAWSPRDDLDSETDYAHRERLRSEPRESWLQRLLRPPIDVAEAEASPSDP